MFYRKRKLIGIREVLMSSPRTRRRVEGEFPPGTRTIIVAEFVSILLWASIKACTPRTF